MLGTAKKEILNALKSKPLPDLPPPSPLRLTPASQKINQFIPGNCPPASPSSKFHPKKSSIAKTLNNTRLKPCALYRVDSQVDERPWIRGGSASTPSTRPASPDEVEKPDLLGLGIFASSGMLLPELIFPSLFEPDIAEEICDSAGVLLSSDVPPPTTLSQIPISSPYLLDAAETSSTDHSARENHAGIRSAAPKRWKPDPCSTRMKGRKHTSTSLSSGFYASVSRTSRIPRLARMPTLSRSMSISTSQSSSYAVTTARIRPTRHEASPKSSAAGRALNKQQSVGRLDLHGGYLEHKCQEKPSTPRSLRKIIGVNTRKISLSSTSPSLALTGHTRLKRRKRVQKQQSFSDYEGKKHHSNADAEFPASAYAKSWHRNRATMHDSPRTPKASAGLKDGSSIGPRDNEYAITHSLPLILPANQDYKYRVEWESEEDVEVDAAESLWRRLELECGMTTGPASPRRGRWRVKVLSTPKISERRLGPDLASEDSVLMTRDNTEDADIFNIIGEKHNGFVGVLREVDDILPSVNDFSNLAETLRKGPGKQQATLIKKSKSQKFVHSDLKRVLGSVWEECDQAEASGWSAQLALLKSRSMSKSKMETFHMEWQTQREDMYRNVLGGGEAPTMPRSITLESHIGDSIIDMYLES